MLRMMVRLMCDVEGNASLYNHFEARRNAVEHGSLVNFLDPGSLMSSGSSLCQSDTWIEDITPTSTLPLSEI